jgi:hypothetical protein
MLDLFNQELSGLFCCFLWRMSLRLTMGNEYNTALVRNSITNKLETICLDTGDVLRPGSEVSLSKYKFDFNTAVAICQSIREGKTLKQIDDDPSLPSLTVVHYWRRNNATFDEEIKLARKDRAEYYHDRVLDLANSEMDKDDVPVAKFKADAYKWAAEKGDPASYGNKIEHSGSNVAPTIVVVTGIERKPDIEVEYEEVHSVGRIDEQDGDSDGSGVQSDMRGEVPYTTCSGNDIVQGDGRAASDLEDGLGEKEVKEESTKES